MDYIIQQFLSNMSEENGFFGLTERHSQTNNYVNFPNLLEHLTYYTIFFERQAIW